jgi:hypothetical protein
MGRIRRSTVALAAIAMLSVSHEASAQLLSFYTTGVFGGTGCGGAPTVCTFGGMTIKFTGESLADPDQPFATPSTVPLGAFSVAGVGDATIGPATFDLTIWQTSPGTGMGTITGKISGSLDRTAPGTGSQLFWKPAVLTLAINSSEHGYVTTFDLTNYAPGGAYKFSPSGVELKADALVTTPEPGTLALLVPAALGLIVPVRRHLKRRVTA